MKRGSTPTLEFELPVPADTLSAAYITIAQHDTTVVEKQLSDCTVSGNVLSVRLSQDDTLNLKHTFLCEIQLRAKTAAGDAIVSEIYTEKTDRILKDGVI